MCLSRVEHEREQNEARFANHFTWKNLWRFGKNRGDLAWKKFVCHPPSPHFWPMVGRVASRYLKWHLCVGLVRVGLERNYSWVLTGVSRGRGKSICGSDFVANVSGTENRLFHSHRRSLNSPIDVLYQSSSSDFPDWAAGRTEQYIDCGTNITQTKSVTMEARLHFFACLTSDRSRLSFCEDRVLAPSKEK
jgi:hypothetical protein